MRSARVKKWINRLAPPLVVGLIRLLGWTLKVTVEDAPGVVGRKAQQEPFLFSFWHNRILMMPYFYQKYLGGRKLTVMMSASRDGQMMVEVARSFGISGARGSSSRHAFRAQIQLVHELKNSGSDVAVTPDGPRGPRYQIQHGILQLAESSGLAILPVTYHLSDKWEMGSWDRFQIPKPFARCRIIVGQPMQVREGDDYQNAAAELRERMGD